MALKYHWGIHMKPNFSGSIPKVLIINTSAD
jgi:hypothetical protein